MATTIQLSDADFVPSEQPGFAERTFRSWVRDPRDVPFVVLVLHMLFVLVPTSVALFVVRPFNWWLAAVHMALVAFVFIDRYTLLLHNTSHRKLWKLDVLNPWMHRILGPLMGQTPETYFGHHIGMHHPENNLSDDLSTTLPYRRDRLSHFAHYWASFFFGGIISLRGYLSRKNRHKLARRVWVGELSWFAAVVGLCFVSWQATLVVFVAPFVVMRFMMMAGNWAQHAFVDAADPNNPYRNSITCINTRYNRRCFNDGYHIGHHVKASRHWTELPKDFLADRANYVANDAIVFQGIDFNGVWWFLMWRDYRSLARYFVELRDEPRSEAEIIALMQSRIGPSL